jgi:hypothetical protein
MDRPTDPFVTRFINAQRSPLDAFHRSEAPMEAVP